MTDGRAAATPMYAWPEGLERPLRVVVVGPPRVPAWIRAFIDLVRRTQWAEAFAVVDAEAVVPRVDGVPIDVRAFVALEHVLAQGSVCFSPIPMAPAVPVDSGVALSTRINGLRPDLAILVGSRAWAGELARRLDCGAWLIDASLLDPRHAGLSLLAPMVRGEKATTLALMLEGTGTEAVELSSSWGRTRATSFLLQREDCFRKVPILLLRGLRRLAAGAVASEAGTLAELALRRPLAGTRVTGLQALATIARASPRWLTAWRRNGRIGWSVVLRLGGPPLDPAAPDLGRHVLFKAPMGWWGDPYAIVADGRRLLFVEEMAEPRRWKAHIACIEIADGNPRRLGVALREPGHLSFPQVFHWQGRWYMTVESGYDRRASLYQATDFPLGWTRVRDLLAGWACVDPTLHHHEGRWYLFANVAENNNNTCDELFLFVADSLEGPFEPHPASPIVSDVRRARMAGRLFEHGGRLIRPAQDCASGYGKALVFNEVLELGPSVYRERPLSRLGPRLASHEMDGLHTYNGNAGIEVLDILGQVPQGAMLVEVADGEGAGDGAAGTEADGGAVPEARSSPRASGRGRPGVPAG